MILGTQRAMYNKFGLRYKAKQTSKSYMSLFARNGKSQVQAWVPKTSLVKPVESNKYWIPKGQVYLVNTSFNGSILGGANSLLVSLIR